MLTAPTKIVVSLNDVMGLVYLKLKICNVLFLNF